MPNHPHHIPNYLLVMEKEQIMVRLTSGDTADKRANDILMRNEKSEPQHSPFGINNTGRQIIIDYIGLIVHKKTQWDGSMATTTDRSQLLGQYGTGRRRREPG
jgi:hypothetical protein